MNKKTIKGFVLGTLFTLLLSSFVTAYAVGATFKDISVMYNNIKLVVDGKTIEFGKDTAGNNIEPFIYNGSTYLPVRAVGEALNKRVDWDGKTGTVYIGKRNEIDADAFLNDMDYFSSGQSYLWGSGGYWRIYSQNSMGKIVGEIQDNAGKTYNNGLGIVLTGAGTGATYGLSIYQEYLLNQIYSKFSGTFVLNHEYRSSNYANAKLKVYGDDKLIYESETLQKGTMPIDFNIDVSGVIKLKVEIVNDSSNNDMNYSDTIRFSIVNPALYIN